MACGADFTWPGMATDVREYVRSCDLCQRNKPVVGKTRGLLQPLPVPTDRWEEVSLDFITGLPPTPTGYDAVLVVVDRWTKWAYFIPTHTTADAKQTSKTHFDPRDSVLSQLRETPYRACGFDRGRPFDR